MLSQTVVAVKNDPAADHSGILIDGEINGQPAILSTKIADRFQKKHKNILREINDLRANLPELFNGLNFEPVEYIDLKGEKRRAYLLTRDAFSLLVMGLTGKAAVVWKLRYIEAFNALEKAALERGADLAREAGYAQGRDETLSLPVMETERRKSYLAGMEEGRRLAAKKDGLRVLLKIMDYREKGLTFAEIGKILDLSANAARKRLGAARKLAHLPEARP